GRNALGRRRARCLRLAAARIHARHADRAEPDRQGDVAAEQACGEIDLRDVDEDALAEPDLRAIGDVAAERDLGIGAAVDIIEQKARQALLRFAAEITYAGDRHSAGLLERE